MAKTINGKKRARVLTPSGMKTCRLPVVLAEGVASRVTDSGEELVAGNYNPSSLISWSEVRAIQIRKTGAGIGAALGLAAGGVLGFLAVRGLSEGDASGGDYAKGIGVVGLLIGLPCALIGGAVTRWKTVYTAPAGTPPAPRISLVPTRHGGAAVSFTLSF
jgi:hypothetical protein